MDAKVKATLIGLSVVTGIVIAVKGYSWAKSKIVGASHTTPLPTTETVTLTQLEADAYCSRIFNCIGGWTGGAASSDNKVFTELLNLSDANLILVSNAFDNDFTDQNNSLTMAEYIDKNDYTSITWDDSAKLVTRLGQITKS